MDKALAILGVIAAGFSAWAAIKSATAAKAANRASDQMVVIEAARRHQELTPEIAVRIEPWGGGNRTTFRLFVGLAGPVTLRQVATLAVQIRDDRPGRATESMSFAGQTATPEQIVAQIWGPLRLTPRLLEGGGQVDQYGRSILIPQGLEVGESRQLQLDVVQPPPWTGADGDRALEWWRSTVGTTVRLSIEMADEAGATWLLPFELDVPELTPIVSTIF